MAITKVKLKQLENATTIGSIPATGASNILTYIAPLAENHLWGYEHGSTETLPIKIGTNLSYDTVTNTLNASAGAGGYSEVQEESGALTARSKLAFIGTGLTAADDAGNSRTTVTLNTFLNTLATAGTVLLSSGNVSGTLPVANGGTGATSLTGILQGNGTGAVTAITNSSTVGQVLRVTGTNTYAWGALDLADTDAITGDLPLANLAQGSALSVLGVAGNAPADNASISAGTDHQVLRRSGTSLGFGAINLASTNAVTGVLAIANGGTGSSTQNFVDLSTNQASIGGDKTFTASTTFSNNVVINGTPSANNHAATVGWVLNNVAGLRSGSVRGATTGILTATAQTATTITLGGTSFTHDGVTYANGETILVKDSVTGGGGGTFNNGVYSVSGVGSSVLLTRVDWMNTAGEIDGVYVLVQDGTSNVGTLWFTVSEVTTLGTDPISFTQIQTTGTVGGTGTNNQISVWSGTNTQDGDSTFTWDQTQMTVGTATPATSARVTIQGTGTGSSTYGLQLNNSSATKVFRVADDGTTIIGASTEMTITSSTISRAGSITINTTGSGGALILNAAANSANAAQLNLSGTGGSFIVESSSAGNSSKLITSNTGTRTYTSGAGANFYATGAYTVSSGTGTYTGLLIDSDINQTGTASGIIRGVHIIPDLTGGVVDYRGLEITANSSHYALYTTAGKIRFDLGSDATGDLITRESSGEMVRIAAGTSGYVLTSNGAGTKPTWQAAASATAVTRAYKTSFTGTTITLNSGTDVTDKDGTNIAFATSGLSADQIFIVKNGVVLSESGTTSRDYTINTGSSVVTLAETAASDDQFLIYKIV